MKDLSEAQELSSQYRGGETARFVAMDVLSRFGEEAAKNYNPIENCFTYKGWLQRGYQVKKGEKAIKSYTFIKTSTEDKKTGKMKITSYRKPCYLFYITQVEEISEARK